MDDEELETWLQQRREKAAIDLNKWRVVGVDNYARESVSDVLHSSYDTEAEAKAKVEQLNGHQDPEPSTWYRVYEPGKQLYLFEP